MSHIDEVTLSPVVCRRRCRHRGLKKVILYALRATVCVGFCLASVKWAAAIWARREQAILRPVNPRVEGRGELWLRCPGSTTWYNYTGNAASERHTTDAPLIVEAW